MHIKSFLKLVEIQTKVASVVPFLIGLSYTLYNFGHINAINTIVMFFSMLLFDMTVTALNNYFDYKRANKKHGYNYEVHNSIVQYDLKESTVVITVFLMFVLSMGLGLFLVSRTDYLVLLVGIICFGVGIIYSYGPLPISRTPFGEIFSGGIMGFFIPFLTIYVSVYDQGLITLDLSQSFFNIGIDLAFILGVIIVTIPLFSASPTSCWPITSAMLRTI